MECVRCFFDVNWHLFCSCHGGCHSMLSVDRHHAHPQEYDITISDFENTNVTCNDLIIDCRYAQMGALESQCAHTSACHITMCMFSTQHCVLSQSAGRQLVVHPGDCVSPGALLPTDPLYSHRNARKCTELRTEIRTEIRTEMHGNAH